VTAKIRNAIESGFNNLEAGPLTFKYLQTANAEAGISFLNYRFKLEGHGESQRVHIHPDHAAFKNLEARINRLLSNLRETNMDARNWRCQKYAQRWRESHTLWQANIFAIHNLEISVERWVWDHGTIAEKHHKPVLKSFGSHSPGAQSC
jgi:hypothetical protein